MDLLARIAERARRKTLYDIHPELTTRIPVLRVASDDALGEAGATFQRGTLEYQRHQWVHRAVNVIANNLAPLPVRVVEGVGREASALDNHPITQLLAAPNDRQSPADIWRQWTVDMLIGGEEGLEYVRNQGGAPSELWPRQPHVIFLEPEKGGARYLRVARYKIDDGGEPYFLAPDELIHFKFYNPANPWRGISPISAVRMAIVIDQLAQAWSRLFFRNAARPDYAIIAPEGMTGTEREELEKKMAAKFGTSEGWHRPLVLEQGVTDVKVFSYPPKDLEWVAQRELAREEIGAVFGVPDEIMGWGRDTYENFKTAVRVLWTLTIIPLVGLRDTILTSFFRRGGLLTPGQRVDTDLSDVEELQRDQTAKIANVTSLWGMGMPFKDANEYLGLGAPRFVGDEVGYLPFSVSPARNLQEEQDEPPDEPEEMPDEESRAANKARIPEFASAEHEALWKTHQRRIDGPVRNMKTLLRKAFKRQHGEIKRRLAERGMVGEVKQEGDVPPVSGLFDPADEAKRFSDTFRGLISETMRHVGASELALLGLDITFDLANPTTVAALRGVLEAFASKTNDTTYSELVALFEEATAAGEAIAQIQRRLDAYFEGRRSDFQTERIARTTMGAASNSASIEAWDQSEVVTGKTWLSALLPDRTRDAHADAHGQTVGLHEMFLVGGERLAHPGDPNGSPGNIINCLCTVVAELRGEEGARPRPKAPAAEARTNTEVPSHAVAGWRKEEDMQVHFHLPEGTQAQLPAPTVLMDMTPVADALKAMAEMITAQKPPQVQVDIAAPPPAAVYVSQPAIEHTIEVQPAPVTVVQDQGETVEELSIEERDLSGRPKRVRRTRRSKARKE